MRAPSLPPLAASLAMLCVVVLGATTSWAHGSSGGRLKLQLAGDTLHIMATPSWAVFKEVDSDGDGRIQKREVRGKRDAMIAKFMGLLQLRDDRGRQATLVFSDLNPLHAHRRSSKGLHVRLNLRLRFAQPPKSIWLAYSAGKTAPLLLSAARAKAGRGPKHVTRRLLARDDTVLTILAIGLHRSPTRKANDRRRKKGAVR